MNAIIKADFQGHTVQFNNDGWFNATAVAAHFGKRPVDWLYQRETLEYVTALANHMDKSNSGFLQQLNSIKELNGISAASKTKLLKLVKQTGLVKTKAGSPDTGGGTWMHPKLGVVFARWLSVEFAVWCDQQIEAIIHGKKDDVDWKRLRHAASSSNKLLNGVLQNVRSAIGKATQHYHYANEAKLVNWALTGAYRPVDRNSLTIPELDLLARLETQNSILIASNMSRDDRKQVLMTIARSCQQLESTQ